MSVFHCRCVSCAVRLGTAYNFNDNSSDNSPTALAHTGFIWHLPVGPYFLVANYMPINFTLNSSSTTSTITILITPRQHQHTQALFKTVTDRSVFQSNCRTILFQAPNYFCHTFLTKFTQSQ